MMGRTHALAAGVGWLAVAPYVNHYHHLTPGGAALGTVVATGAGLTGLSRIVRAFGACAARALRDCDAGNGQSAAGRDEGMTNFHGGPRLSESP